MQNMYIKILLFAFFTCSISACKKQLDVFPTSQEVDGNVIADRQGAQTVLNGVYYLFADAVNQQQIQWVSVNEVPASGLSGLVASVYSGYDLAEHTYNSQSYTIPDMWNYNYAIINAANGFIKNVLPVTSIADSVKTEMIGEARFLRAFANTNLLLYFGQYADVTSKYGNMLRTEFVSSKNLTLPRSTVAETYDYIVTDLDSAIAALPNINAAGNTSASVWAAKLLKARLLINRNAEGDNASVISLTKDMIANSPFTLEDSVKDIFLNKNLASKEVILGVQPFPTQAYKYQYLNYIFSSYIASDSLLSMLANDPRSNWMVKKGFNYFIPDGAPVITKYYTKDVNNPTPDPLTEYSYAFRLTEAYLLEAEAIVASGGEMNEARDLLKTVLQHAGFTEFTEVDAATTQAQLQLLIVKEEMKNFVFESGLDWFAVRRLPFATLQNLLPTIKNKEVLTLPIPQTEINRNLQIQQNPGY